MGGIREGKNCTSLKLMKYVAYFCSTGVNLLEETDFFIILC